MPRRAYEYGTNVGRVKRAGRRLLSCLRVDTKRGNTVSCHTPNHAKCVMPGASGSSGPKLSPIIKMLFIKHKFSHRC
ncbi:hypothetical protein E2C01_020461 [Portunus trituberculatus]|uniref:Uncharacterized protein n=1 Tax=Portunus trituberculatus TaxID=210409 RepID=A0A5B7E386_PORTR|nr:hypothetical protein [Portunus trituberculatus]